MNNLTPITREEMLMNDEPLTPITREEKILAGEDLECVTRREYFLKKYRHAGGDVMVEGLSVTENGTYTAPEGKAYSPVEVAVPLPENAYLLKEASGSLVSFSDGADLPMPSFICNITANQDLHGYDRPWPPGGGKNLLETTATSQTINGVTYTVNDDGTVTVNGTATDLSILTVGEVSLIDGTSYVLSSSSTNDGGFYLQAIGTGIAGVNTISGAITFSSPADITSKIRIVVAINKTVNNVVVKPMLCLESAQNPTVFVPYKYENICPISGHTGVDAWVRGQNLWSFGDITQLIDGAAFHLKAGTYTIKADVSNVGTTLVGLRMFYADDTNILVTLSNTNNYQKTFTLTDDVVKINASVTNGTATNVQLEIGETATTFEPYNPNSQTISVSWQTEAGEVYGGEVDLVSGVLTVDRASTTLGQFTYTYNSINKLFYSGKNQFPSTYQSGYASCVCSHYLEQQVPGNQMSDKTIKLHNGQIHVKDTSYTEVTAFETAVADVQIVYQLANPITYQLTPTQIKSLKDDITNAWCSTGDVDIDYFAKEV